MKTLIYIFLAINAFGLNINIITKIPSRELIDTTQSDGKELPLGFIVSSIRKDGCFIAGGSFQKQVVVTDTGKYICFDTHSYSHTFSTNIISIVQNPGGENTFTIDVLWRQSSTNNKGVGS